MAILLEGPFGSNLRLRRECGACVSDQWRHHLIAALRGARRDRVRRRVSAPRFRIIDPDSYGILTSIFTRLSDHRRDGLGLGRAHWRRGARIVPELLRPLADYHRAIFCMLVVATLTFFRDEWPRRSRERLWRARGGHPGARDVQVPRT